MCKLGVGRTTLTGHGSVPCPRNYGNWGTRARPPRTCAAPEQAPKDTCREQQQQQQDSRRRRHRNGTIRWTIRGTIRYLTRGVEVLGAELVRCGAAEARRYQTSRRLSNASSSSTTIGVLPHRRRLVVDAISRWDIKQKLPQNQFTSTSGADETIVQETTALPVDASSAVVRRLQYHLVHLEGGREERQHVQGGGGGVRT